MDHRRSQGSFFEFSSTSIHYWTTKSLNSLNRLTNRKKRTTDARSETAASKSTVFGVESNVSAATQFYSHQEYHSYEREERIRHPSTSISEHFATLGRNAVRKPTTFCVDQYSTRTSSMERKRHFEQQSVSKSESRLDDNGNATFDPVPSSCSYVPGQPLVSYEDRYEASSAVDVWMQTQSLGKRLLDKHDRMVMKFKDERDAIQKKTFTKWVNKHLSKSKRHVDDLYVDLRDGFNLIALLEALSGETLPRENGYTRFHRIQNVQYVLEFLRRKNIKVVNIRAEDIVEGNAKLTLGLIWTIILNFQVSVIKIRQQQEALAKAAALAHTSVSSSTTDAVLLESTSSYYQHLAASGDASLVTASQSVVLQREVSEVLAANDGVSAKEALLQWARKVTHGYPGVNVTNFTNSWRDGLAFNAILHRYRPNLVNWNKVSDPHVHPQDRLRNAFDLADNEFGVSKLLDPEDVDVEKPDEKSIITYVSSLYNALPHLDELSKGNLDDIISRLTRGIGIVNEKLDLILKRIEEVEARADTADASEIRRAVEALVEDLGALEAPIDDLFDDVNILKENNHPRTNEFYRQVYGLHQRRNAYLDRLQNQILVRLGVRNETLSRKHAERTKSTFESLEEAIRWVRERLERLNNMVFSEDLESLEEMFEQHKIDNRDIQDFNQTVKECIARQAEVSAEDSHEYCELLSVLESEYQQLRDLSAGRMLDLDSLIAFIRAAQMELIWIHEREDIEVTRNWSDINQLDLPMLQNYYKQLLHEIELREKQFNEVHNQGAALLNQRHPAIEVIEVYLRSLQNQWDWLLGLTKCLEGHLRDALTLKSFQEEVAGVEEWIKTQTEYLENNFNRTDFTVEEGEQWLKELNTIREIIQKYHELLMNLANRSAQISPLWQRGERIRQPINVTAWCDYKGKDIEIRAGDDVTLLDNSDLINWTVRGVDGVQAQVPSVVFRIPPPDPQLTNHLARLAAQLDKLRKLWDRKHRMIRYNMMMSTMRSIQGWDLDTFLSYPQEQRDEIIKALNDDVNKLLSEMDPNDPLALRLKEELRRTNEHFMNLLNQSYKGPEVDLSNEFDRKLAELLKKLEEAWKKLNDRAVQAVPRTAEELEQLVNDHRAFEDALQSLDTDVSNVKELFRQLPNPTPTQLANHDYLNSRWEDIWDLSRMYVERLKVLQQVLQGIEEVSDIVRRHEITLSSFDDMPAALDKLRGVHSQLLELNMVLQQQENIIHSLNQNVAQLRQHVARTRFNVASHPDVDNLEDQVQQLTVRWDNVCTQVTDRLKVAEDAQQTQMIYRSQYDEEIQWLDRVENTINNLRKPEQLRPEELQAQLDMLMSEYSQLQEHTATIENINKEGGKFIREAKNYDNRLDSFADSIASIHGPGIRNEFRRTKPQPKNGAQIVTEELEALNRRFAQLSSVILERRNQLNVLIQNWKRKQQEEADQRRAEDEAKIAAFEAARLQALEEANRLRSEREAAEAARRAAEEAERQAADEAERLRRERVEAETARRSAEHAELAKRAAEEAEANRRALEHSERQQRDSEERRRRELEELRAAEENERRRKEDEDKIAAFEAARQQAMEEANRLRSEREAAEAARRAAEEAERRAAEEAERLKRERMEAEAARRAAEEAELARRTAEEAELRRRATEEAERQRSADEERRRKDDEDRLQREEEARRAVEEAERRRAEDEAKIAAFEAARQQALEEANLLRSEREAAEAARRAAEEAERHANEEAERLKRERMEAEAARRAAEEAELARRAAEEAEAHRRANETAERQRLTDEERRRREDEERRAAEEAERRRAEDEAKIAALEAARLQALEEAKLLRSEREAAETARRAAEEAERQAADEAERLRRERVEAEAARRAAEEAELTRRAAEEAETERRALEEADRRRTEDEERYRQDEERRNAAEEAARRRSEDEAKIAAFEAARQQALEEAMSSFWDNANAFAQWLDKVEDEMNQFGEISIYPEELADQSEILANITVAVTEQQDLFSQVVQDSNELINNSTGADAIALQYRIDNLYHRYTELSNDAEQKIDIMTEAIPLSEDVHAGISYLQMLIEECNADLDSLDQVPLEQQIQLIAQMEAELVNNRVELDDVYEKSLQLQQLAGKSKADELARKTADLNRHFNALNDEVLRRIDMLTSTEGIQNKPFDDVEDSAEWFDREQDGGNDGAQNVEQLKLQLRNQALIHKEFVDETPAQKDHDFSHWALWLEDLLSELSNTKPVGGLPETAQNQLDDFRMIMADVEAKRSLMDVELNKLDDLAKHSSDSDVSKELCEEMHRNWTKVNEKLTERQKKLENALQDAIALNDDMQDMTRWLDNAENYLSNLPLISRLLQPLEKQIDEHIEFVDNVSAQRQSMSDLSTRASKIQYSCDKGDAIPIKNRMINLKHRFDKVVNRSADRTKSCEAALGESKTYFDTHKELSRFIDDIAAMLNQSAAVSHDVATGDRLQEDLEDQKKLQEDLKARKPLYESTEKRGRVLEEHAPTGEKADIHAINEELIRKWKDVSTHALQRRRSLEDALVQSGKFDEALTDVFKWFDATLPSLEADVNANLSQGDLETLTSLYTDHTNVMDDVKQRKAGVDTLKARAEKILNAPTTSDKERADINAKLQRLNEDWKRLEDACETREAQLSDGLKVAVDLDELMHDLKAHANDTEGRLRRLGEGLPEDEPDVLSLLDDLKVIVDDVAKEKRPEVEKAIEMGKHMLEKCHPKADGPLRELLGALDDRWNAIDQNLNDRINEVNEHLAELRKHDDRLNDLTDFIVSKEGALEFKDAEGEPQELNKVDDLMQEHDLFMMELTDKQPEVDEVIEATKIAATKARLPTILEEPATPTKGPRTPTQAKPKPQVVRKSRRQHKTDAVADRWSKLWEHTRAYDARLKERKDYLAEMKRLEKFTFEDWRERYLAWNDNAKARISDLFRRIDTTGTGNVPRKDFINGILNSKFPTTVLEMNRVADEFDKGDGKISAKEFMNALRYSPKQRQPAKSATEMIHEELRKENERCTCAHRFPIQHISTNKDKVQYGFGFGGTMKKMVRILRSTVMVRVGGGWERLDEFLLKHDPCRAAGRLNINKGTPPNALDYMQEFKTRRSTGGTMKDVLNYADGTPGPISKVLEKTERSMPMFKKPQGKPSSRDSPIAPYSSRRSSDVNYGDSKIPRPSPSVSRSNSRHDLAGMMTPTSSRPPSRMSAEDFEDRPPSRIPSIRGAKGVRYQSGASSARGSPHPF